MAVEAVVKLILCQMAFNNNGTERKEGNKGTNIRSFSMRNP